MRMSRHPTNCIIAVLGTAAILGIVSSVCAFEAGEIILKRENFDKDPNWEGFNNRVIPKHSKVVKQDFGYSQTNRAGRASGEIGGQVQRSTTPAYCAGRISPKTLNDPVPPSKYDPAPTSIRAGAAAEPIT